MGKYKDESQILTGQLQKGAIQYKEPNTITRAFCMGGLISLPIIIALIVLILIKIQIWNIQFGNIDVKSLVISVIAATILNQIFIIIHELLHAVSYPQNGIKEIWFKPNELAAFVYYSEAVSKKKFIWICLCPNVILGFIPYILWILSIFDFNIIVSQTTIIFAMFNILGGIGDYLNVYLTIKQVPKNALVQNYGYHSYWFEKIISNNETSSY